MYKKVNVKSAVILYLPLSLSFLLFTGCDKIYLPHTWTTPLPQHTPHNGVEIPLGIDVGTIPNQYPGEGGAKLGVTTGISYFSHPVVFGADVWGWFGNYTITVYNPPVRQNVLSAGGILTAGLVPKLSKRVKMNISLTLGASYEEWSIPQISANVPLVGLRFSFIYLHPSEKWQAELGYMDGLGGSLFTILRINRFEGSLRVMPFHFLSSTSEVPSVSMSLCYFIPTGKHSGMKE